MTGTEARYLHARNAAHRAWAGSQPQYVIPGLLDALDEPALLPGSLPRAGSSSAPALTGDATEPCHGTPDGLTAIQPAEADTRVVSSVASLTSTGPGRMSSRDRRGRGR